MKPYWQWMVAWLGIVLGLALGLLGSGLDLRSPKPSEQEQVLALRAEAEYRTAIFEVGKIYGKAGCGDYALASATVRRAREANVKPELLAAVVATESHCDPLAVSKAGAVGLTQVMPRLWKKDFDFTRLNLFNPEDSLSVGAKILRRKQDAHGAKAGVARYNGQGPQARAYGNAVLKLSGQ